MIFHAKLAASGGNNNYSQTSVLASGKWFKIAVIKDGIYKIEYSKLLQLGIDNPSFPKIYGNNYGQLSYNNDDPKPDDLREIPIFISGNDDKLNEGEYILFYGESPHKWKYNNSSGNFDFLRHNYSDTAYYFITSSSVPGKKVTTAQVPSGIINTYSSHSDALFIHETESENLIHSGREWFEPLSLLKGTAIVPSFNGELTNDRIKFSMRVAARASQQSKISLCEGNNTLKNIDIQGIYMADNTGTYARIVTDTFSIIPTSSSLKYEIRFSNNNESSALGWLDYIKIQARVNNVFNGTTTKYTDSKSAGAGHITQFSVNSVSEPVIWDVTDPFNIKNVSYTRSGTNIIFSYPDDSIKTFIAFSSDKAINPVIDNVIVPNQDLHSSPRADMIIVTHPLFKPYAEKLASVHLAYNNTTSLIVTPEQIYNEFSGGIPDICAIRNFLRMKFVQNEQPRYLLLFGDGSYNNKSFPPDNPSYIPTYQSPNSNIYISSYTSDDFYGLLEDGEGEVSENGEITLNNTLDIGIGRLPVSDTSQANVIVEKIINYLNPATMGDWKNMIVLVADDEDDNVHLDESEKLATLTDNYAPSLNVEKIYFDAYKQTTTVNGQFYPDVTKAINSRINSGCLIFNYVGHGNEYGLAHESVTKTEDINSWNNGSRLPLFITATCEFSRFDDVESNTYGGKTPGKNSAGELVLMNKSGGGIALMSTTRIVSSAPNSVLNENIFKAAFDRAADGSSMTFGDIIRIAKNNSPAGINKRSFMLLGDPAIKLAYPWHGKVVTDSVNNISVVEHIDTLKALSLVTINGHIENINGSSADKFNGYVSARVYDKKVKIKTLGNDDGLSTEFSALNSLLFNGRTIAENGRFRFTFIVPRNIDFTFGNGKITYYANDSENDMNGYLNNIVVGGFSNSIDADNEGPEIKLYMNDTLFHNGGITDSEPILLAIVEDTNGINTTGSGIGHDITVAIDGDQSGAFVLNNYFENDLNSFRKGRITYRLNGLKVGKHTLSVKVWDNYNNSSVETLSFMVESDNKFLLKELINYPNPFSDKTHIIVEHNRPEAELDITINIFSMDGRIIKTIKQKTVTEGYSLPPLEWNGNDDGGKRVGKGIYPYKIVISTDSGEKASISGKMIIL
jgi:hypothetical protein